MKESRTRQANRAPLIVQTFHTNDLDDLFQNIFRTTVAAERLHHVRQADWRSDRAFEAAMSAGYLRSEDVVLAEMRDECDLYLTIKRRENIIQLFACAKFRQVKILMAGRNAQSVEAILREHGSVFDTFAKPPESNRPYVNFNFWYLGEKGAEREEKELKVPAWKEIRGNYHAGTAGPIDGFLSGFKPANGGRLLLWHGKPGTGKTFAIRALAWEWRQWCQFEYVIDPENLFGPRADYLARMIIDGNEAADENIADRWRMLVLEDTGELLGVDAKERAGQGLSRLLNSVDGLLGQGSRVLLLITTNEEMGALHPAVTRPGRCASQVEFLPLSPAEAKIWLTTRNEDCDIAAPKGPKTIAELYAMLEGRRVCDRPPIGFARNC